MKTQCCLIGLVFALTVTGQTETNRPAPTQSVKSNESLRFDGARTEVYKTVGGDKLTIHIFEPENHKPSDKRPAIVFFFGGGWIGGTPQQFEQHCRYLASRGMVAMTADYRVLTRHGTPAVKCVEDGKSAVRWIRENAKRLGVDPKRIAAGGGSAGGHIAACTGLIDGFDSPLENKKISSRPDAMVLFNPALVLAWMKRDQPPLSGDLGKLQERMGVEPEKLSPTHHVKKNAPPTLVLHGKEDKTVPYWTAETFRNAMNDAKNRCELIGYEDQPHSFFNYRSGKNSYFFQTLEATDNFLVSLGYLRGSSTIGHFFTISTPEK